MIHRYSYKDITWIDLETPNRQEISEIVKEFSLHPLIGEELMTPTHKGKVDFYEDYLYLVLHFPIRSKHHSKYIVTEKEVDFVVGKKFIITTRYDTIEPLHNFSKVFETNSILDNGSVGEHAGFVFYYMVKSLYRNARHDLELITGNLLNSEKHVFNGDERQMVKVLSEISRELIDFRQITRAHTEILESFQGPSKKLFGDKFSYYTDNIQTEYDKIYGSVNHARDLLNDLRVTNDSLLSTKQNETIRTLTIMAFVTFPLSLIADLFSMETSHTPILGSPYDFEIIFAIMLIAAGFMFAYFKHKKWL